MPLLPSEIKEFAATELLSQPVETKAAYELYQTRLQRLKARLPCSSMASISYNENEILSYAVEHKTNLEVLIRECQVANNHLLSIKDKSSIQYVAGCALIDSVINKLQQCMTQTVTRTNIGEMVLLLETRVNKLDMAMDQFIEAESYLTGLINHPTIVE